ncbi:MAG: DNA gyrase inhibitor YacG, partial [Alphaproteobacteria bacterium]
MMAQDGKRAGRRKAGCPMCGARVEHEFRPFCSRRCADGDLS